MISGAALVILLIGCALVLRPFATSLLWAVVLWLATAPLHRQVLAWVRGRHTVAAALEGIMVGLPAIACSLQSWWGRSGERTRGFDFAFAAAFAARLVESL